MILRVGAVPAFLLLLACCDTAPAPEPVETAAAGGLVPGSRVLVDAHNCYPYHGEYADRIERALGLGVPLAIEQDLRWHVDADSGEGASLVAHDPPLTGDEPSLREHFFERIRPLMEAELAGGDRSGWPVITLNLDFKTEEPEHLAYVWDLLGEYAEWLTSAPKQDGVSTMKAGPLLVLTGNSDAQAAVFHGALAYGEELRLFGAVPLTRPERGDMAIEEYAAQIAALPPDEYLVLGATSYRRWSNHPWMVVEAGGQNHAGDWTEADAARLAALVRRSHELGLWIRFYTLNGHDPEDTSGGWFGGYSFGSSEAVRVRWEAAVEAGVDYVATDQYEAFHEVLAVQ